MKIAIINYDAGNIRSVIFALERLGVEALLTSDIETITTADKVIFPGQGEASSAMRSLRERGLDKVIPHLKQPFLGVCVGMQLLCDYSEENDTPCLGVIPQRVRRFPSENGLKVPHVGWNTIQLSQNTEGGASPSSILSPHFDNDYFYFVHSYYVEKGIYTTATCDYGVEFAACLRKDNFHAAQFHPEKSSRAGEQLIKNFLEVV
ncbi:MAG: imidazole glycerol phosphate synthase subunit HisH [Saprospiraceae bacterium]|nr:imidazole glycerol phosphate synthase subunit HisH [Saprospiraceae bacterium]